MTNGIRVMDLGGETIGMTCESCRPIIQTILHTQELEPDDSGICFRCGKEIGGLE